MLPKQPKVGEEPEAGGAKWPAATLQELEVVLVGVVDVGVVGTRMEHSGAEGAPNSGEGCGEIRVTLECPMSGQVPQTSLAVEPGPGNLIPVFQVCVM